jgi:hypothetical protein
MRTRRTLLIVAGMAIALLPGCRQEAGGEATLSIQSPGEGDSISGPVPLAVSVEGAEIGPPETGNMHIHVYVGDSGDYEVVTTSETTLGVPDGSHTLRVVLAQPNHDETATTDSVRVSVSGGAPPSPATEEDTGGGGGTGGYGDSGGGGYGY